MESDAMDGQVLLGVCERIAAMAASRGADQAEVYMEQGHRLELDLEKDMVHSVNTHRGRGGAIRVITDGRLGFAYFTDPDKAADAIGEALDAARHAPSKGFMLPGPSALPVITSRWDPGHAAMETDAAFTLAEELVQGVKEQCRKAVVGGGGIGVAAGLHAIASTEGIACHDRTTRISAGVSLLLQEGDRALNTWDTDTLHVGRLDAHGLGVRAAALVESLRHPQPVKQGGRFDVILHPHAADLITDLVENTVDGDDAMRGKTLWSGRLGETVAATHLQVRDDPLLPGAVGTAPFDDEGLPAQTLPIIDDGVLRNYLFDCWDAHEHGQKSTHSAVRSGFKSPPGTGHHHMVVQSRNTMPEEKLIAGIDDGFIVETVLGAHTANATTGEFSVTAPNVWRIHAGAVVGPCSEIALSGSLAGWLQRLDAASDDPRRMDGLTVPALRFADVQVSV